MGKFTKDNAKEMAARSAAKRRENKMLKEAGNPYDLTAIEVLEAMMLYGIVSEDYETLKRAAEASLPYQESKLKAVELKLPTLADKTDAELEALALELGIDVSKLR